MSTAPAEILAAASPPRRAGFPALRRFRRHPLAMAGAAVIALMVLACAVGPSLLPFTDVFIDIRSRFAPPGSGGGILVTLP